MRLPAPRGSCGLPGICDALHASVVGRLALAVLRRVNCIIEGRE
jgi:hypothetical protein